MNKKNLIGKLKKYIISKQVWILCLIVFIISFIFIIILSMKVDDMLTIPIDQLQNADREARTIFMVLIDSLTVVCSITGTNLLTSLLIQVKIQNQAYKDFIVDDLILDENFLKSLPDEKRIKIYNKLSEIDHPTEANGLYHDFTNSFLEALNKEKSSFYYEQLDIDISCVVTDKYLIKEVTQKWKIRAFEQGQEFPEKYPIIRLNCQDNPNTAPLELRGISVDGIMLVKGKDVSELITESNDDPLGIIKGYVKRYAYYLLNPPKISPDKTTVITFKYKTCVLKNDMNYGYRLKAPCRNFNFDFKIRDEKNANKKFKIISRIYGIQYDTRAPGNVDSQDGQRVRYNFDNWGAKNDGVSISFYEDDT